MSGNNAGSAGAFDLSVKLRQRRAEMNSQRERTQANINGQTELLQRMFTHKPRRPRDTLAQMDAKLIDLEYQRTRTSLSLSEEKLILRQKDSIKRSKIQLDEYSNHERGIQEKKNEISALRDSLRTIIASIAELESAVSKVELARRLGCTVAELQTRVIDCPEEKLGSVIGKNGATIKQIEQRTGVLVDVDKIGLKIHLQGSESALKAAAQEVEKITLAVSDDVIISDATMSFLLTKRLGAFAKLQQDHSNVYFDLTKDTHTMTLRGMPNDVVGARNDLECLSVVSRAKEVSQKEAGLIVGKGGITINKLSETHSVVLNVTNNKNGEKATVEIVGTEANVDTAYADVEDIIFQNEELEETVVVRNMQRNKLLSNSASVIKQIQAEVNSEISGGGGCLLVFEKRSQSRDGANEPSKLLIKTSRANMLKAKGIVQKHIDAYEADIVRVDVRPDIVPAVLGKGGATINSLRKEGAGAEIDIDKTTGVCFIQSEDTETRALVKAAIEKIITENQIKKVEVKKSMIGLLLGGESGKEMREKISEIGANLSVDSSDRYMVLRGTVDQVNESATILQEFIDCNYTEERVILPDDQGVLFHGGSESLLKKVEIDHDVRASVRKTTNLLVVRGRKESVDAALVEVRRFLEGDDTFAVCKLKVQDGLIGVVIGKGGANISKLEEENEGVLIQASGDTSILSIRGPVVTVEKCRSQVISQLATARVTENVAIMLDQYESLSASDYLRKLSNSTGTQVNLSENMVKIRGTSANVKDANALLLEHLTGTYKQSVELEQSQLTRVGAAAKDPSHFERIQNATQTEVSLDYDMSSILISGKRGNVKKAKTFVMGFLDFLLPSEFDKVKVAKPLMKAMSDPAELAKIAADSGASVCLDRDLSSVLVRSSRPEMVEKAAGMVRARLMECEKLNFVQRVDHSDLWLFPIIIGKGGGTVQQIQQESGCSIDISKEELTIAISGSSENDVNKGKDALFSLIDKARKECVFVDLPESAMPAFIGKSGSHIKQLSAEHDVAIERLRKEPTRIQIKGDELSAKSAQEAVLAWVSEWEDKNIGVTVDVEDAVIPSILGKGGSTISSITGDHGVKIDINRKALTLTIRGGSHTERDEALNKIRCIISEHAAKKAELEEAQRKATAEIAATKVARAAAATRPAPKEEQKSQREIKDDDKPDRTREFAAIPVGLTVVENTKRRSKKPKSKKVASSAVMLPADSRGTNAGQSLFNMLVSDNDNQAPGLASAKTPPPALVDEQWDSSTVSSGATSSETEHEEDEAEVAGVPEYSHFKSTSGFNVRV
eukprot:CAMPEP_0113591436 /NCGR_PEP_ID=MMETSP0015_2-20120614/37269_1 /TAXON_ID=2838 /ORGANISM="Odontella" /LENGTH=1296 /DNA_ID=CAMNT_0000497819 /DNA_START=165 /DNA_END=4055 /DNA_ORIENTATION=- /assembly_acc=CAM_ASM_000160